MSSLADIWTTEFAKLREKGKAIFSTMELSPAANVEERSAFSFPALSQTLKFKPSRECHFARRLLFP